jgi:hypothetical protein
VALQGDLQSFALPDVLRLLAATTKSGQLDVGAPAGGGELRLWHGGIVSGAVSTAPQVREPAEVLFELLRLDDGSFVFHEGEQPEAPVTEVETAIGDAERLVAEWTEVETVVPSMGAWVTLLPELEGDRVEIDAARWRVLAAIGGGGNVRDLAGALELTDLAACRAVKDLVEGQLVDVRPTHGYAPVDAEPTGPTYELTDFEVYERHDLDGTAELEQLTADDRPVVMEDRDDALLPEPLPSEGVAYEGEMIGGTVDGRAYDPSEHEGHDPHEVAHGDDLHDPSSAELAPDDVVATGTSADGFGEVGADSAPVAEVTAFPMASIDGTTRPGSGDIYAALAPERLDQESSPLEPIPGMPDLDEERTSLLRFLSSVKP